MDWDAKLQATVKVAVAADRLERALKGEDLAQAEDERRRQDLGEMCHPERLVRCPMRIAHDMGLIASCYGCRGTDAVPSGFAIEYALLDMEHATQEDRFRTAARLFVYELKRRHCTNPDAPWIAKDPTDGWDDDWRAQLARNLPTKCTLEELIERFPPA